MGYSVSKSRSQRMTFSSTGDNNVGVSATWHQEYCVDVTGSDIATHSAYDVLNAPGIPIVGKTTYTTGTKILPYVVCRDKTAQQNPKKLSRWTVKTKFSTPPSRSGGSGAGGATEAENAPIAVPAAITDISPVQSVSLGQIQKVLYFENAANALAVGRPPRDCALTPTGNWWSQPVMQKLPTFRLKHTQYEARIEYETMLERKFKINENEWNSKPAFMWLISDVEATEVEVELIAGTTTAAMVTYTIDLHPDARLDPALENNVYGWREVRALFDTQYWSHPEDDPDRKLKAFQTEIPGKASAGYIDIDGLKRADQTGEPDYIDYMTFDRINFNTFLNLP